jgi:segregation and condensation protein A
VASEFNLTAATLMRIKAKMLLPRTEKDAQGNEIDPRQELIQHLLEYKKYKGILGELGLLEEERQQLETRGNIPAELQLIATHSNLDYELQDLSLYKLMQVFSKAMTRYEEEQHRPQHTVYTYPYTIEEQKAFIVDRIRATGGLDFTQIIAAYPEKIGLIFNFLALLELLQLNLISIVVGEGFNNFRITTFNENQAA